MGLAERPFRLVTRHYHQAVMQAAIRINAEAQAKLARMDLSETSLFNQAFSLDPAKPGASRLRLMADDGSQPIPTAPGARAFAEGLYAAIRNPGVHTVSSGDDEQLAMEQLAAFSLLARWVDAAAVESTGVWPGHLRLRATACVPGTRVG